MNPLSKASVGPSVCLTPIEASPPPPPPPPNLSRPRSPVPYPHPLNADPTRRETKTHQTIPSTPLPSPSATRKTTPHMILEENPAIMFRNAEPAFFEAPCENGDEPLSPRKRERLALRRTNASEPGPSPARPPPALLTLADRGVRACCACRMCKIFFVLR